MKVKEFIKMSESYGFNTYLNDDVNVFLDDDRTEVFNNLVSRWVDEGETEFYVVEVKTASEYYVVNKYSFYIKIKGDDKMEEVYEKLISAMEKKLSQKGCDIVEYIE